MTFEVAAFIAASTDVVISIFALFLAGSCRSRCCAGSACDLLDIAHEEKDDKLDVEMECRRCSSIPVPSDKEN